jgi:hypothetical protein
MDIDKDMDSSEEWYHIMIDNMIVSAKPQNLVAKMEKTQKNCYVPVMCSICSCGVWVSWFWDLGIKNSEICVTSF